MEAYKEALQTIKILVGENEIFERTIKRKDPARLSSKFSKKNKLKSLLFCYKKKNQRSQELSQVVQSARLAQMIAPLNVSQHNSKTTSITDSIGLGFSSTASVTSGTASGNSVPGGHRSMRALRDMK